MAFGADFKMDFRLRRARLEGFAASAFDDCFDIIRMYPGFHIASDALSNYKDKVTSDKPGPPAAS
jgi:hypothetical protein